VLIALLYLQSVKRSDNVNNRIEPNFGELCEGLLNYRWRVTVLSSNSVKSLVVNADS
jgi:hypothetical protein